MISQFLIPIFILVCTVSAWGACCLPAPRTGKILFFLLCVFGLAYIVPLGPYFDPALYLPYAAVLAFAVVSAFAFFYFWMKVMHFSIILFPAFFSIFAAKYRAFSKTLLLSPKINTAEILCCAVLAVFSVYSTVKVPAINRVSLYYKDLPDTLNGYTIAQITDTHTGLLFRKNWQEGVVQKIMAEKPDLIVHTGDIGDARPQDIAEHLAPLQKLSAPDGVYYVFGNHENYHILSYWQEYFQKNNMHVLENSSVQLRNNLILIGAKSQPRYRNLALKEILADIPDGSFKIFLDHYPLRFRTVAPFIDLQLSGHTHGGTVFFLAPAVALFNGGFISGVYEQNGAKLYVSSGTGIWTYTPFRLFVPSEITLIKLIKG